MTRYAPQWIQSGTYAASLDRNLLEALWPTPASVGCAVTAAGTGMDLHVDPGQVAVPTANGTVLCTSDGVETIPTGAGGILPAPPAGTDRRDLIVCHPRSVDLDGSSAQEDFIFEAVTGAEGAPPGVAPAVPAGTVALAEVHVAGGAASLTAADITDRRPFALAVAGPSALPPPLAGGDALQSFADSSGEMFVAKGGVYAGAWKRARDVVRSKYWRVAAYTFPAAANSLYVYDTKEFDPYGLYSTGGTFTCPVAGVYSINATVYASPTSGGMNVAANHNGTRLSFFSNGVVAPSQLTYNDRVVCAKGDTLQATAWNYNATAPGQQFGRGAGHYLNIEYLGTG